MYALLRAIAGVALRWYYRDIHVVGTDRIPRDRPLLLVVNHPNALVDALLVGWIMPRRVLITAKATIFKNPVGAALLGWLGVLPLRRTSDEPAAGGGTTTGTARNAETFRAVHDALARRRCVLIFPEGKTPDEPALAPLKTGAARMALHARASGDVEGLALLPIGLVFEQKETPRSRVFVEVGEPILLDQWPAGDDKNAADALTAEIEARLRALTLSYATADDAARARRLAMSVASIIEPTEDLARSLALETAIARRIDRVSAVLSSADETSNARAEELLARLEAVEHEAEAHGIQLDDACIELGRRPGMRFVVREGLYLLIGGPVALWGRINHWLPLRAARLIAMRKVQSTADPAMRTIIAGAALILVAYLLQTLLVGLLWGWVVAALYLISLPVAADVNFRLTDRMRRAKHRARAYLVLRENSALRTRLAGELAGLRNDFLDFDRAVVGSAPSWAVDASR